MAIQSHNSRGGYTLLFAVLISSLVLALGLSILTISKKELLLSSAGRESQFAFYAADTGAECAMYWDFKGDFPYSNNPPASPVPRCNAQNLTVNYSQSGPSAAPVDTFTIVNVSLDQGALVTAPCATVTITKSYSVSGGVATLINTKIEGRGYNTCETSNPQKVERALRITY